MLEFGIELFSTVDHRSCIEFHANFAYALIMFFIVLSNAPIIDCVNVKPHLELIHVVGK